MTQTVSSRTYTSFCTVRTLSIDVTVCCVVYVLCYCVCAKISAYLHPARIFYHTDRTFCTGTVRALYTHMLLTFPHCTAHTYHTVLTIPYLTYYVLSLTPSLSHTRSHTLTFSLSLTHTHTHRQFLQEYYGECISLRELNRRMEENVGDRHLYAMQLHSKAYLDSKNKGRR
jgi:hypothetical protein